MRCRRRTRALAALALLASPLLAARPAPAGEPTTYSWQRPHAKVIETGDLEWAPEPFAFERGDSVRYIDYEAGDDANEGMTKDKPWKHHPWDAHAAANPKATSGRHTYVFKRGVIYRGLLVADDSGAAGDPIRLTSDPSWGDGEAALVASRAVTSGWQRADASSAPGIPEPEKIWYLDLPKGQPQPRAVWEVRDGKVTRVALARDPNWTITDPNDIRSNWYAWQDGELTEIEQDGNKVKRAWAVDKRVFKEPDPNAYKGATLWTEYTSVMGSAYAVKIDAYDPERGRVRIGGPWGEAAANYRPVKDNRYYLENLPRYLDTPGEFYFAATGEHAGRLYVRLADDRDPNSAHVELAAGLGQVDIRNQSHVHVTGLTFRFGNVAQWSDRWWTEPEGDPAAIRLLGNCQDIRISHNKFEHVPQPLYAKALGDGVAIDDLVVTDNDIAYTDYGGLEISHGSSRRDRTNGALGTVTILRNRFQETGHRPRRANHGHTLVVEFPQVAEVAGNILDRTYGAGIFVFGGLASSAAFDGKGEAPLTRILVHHNKVTNPLLNTNDWGGIETWQGGTFYVYNNVSGNPGGYWHWKHLAYGTDPAKRNHNTARFGFAYYLDGSFKNYLFNNIAWGNNNDLLSPLANSVGLMEVLGFNNTFANNTFYRFVAGSRRQAPQGGRNAYLGNVWADMSEMYFRHSDLDRPQDINLERETSNPDRAYDTLAYASNVFHGSPRTFGHFELNGPIHQTLESFRGALEKAGAIASQVGWVAEKPPLRDAAKHDFRPASDSAAIDRGVKIFAPWSLYGTVAEWHFRRPGTIAPDGTAKVLGEHWYMTADHVNRDMYRRIPRNDLTVHGVTRDSFVDGPLEDWMAGAMKFDGKSTYGSLSHEAMAGEYSYRSGRSGATTVPASHRKSADMDTNSFLIETYFRTEPGHTGGVIASKLADTGYELYVDPFGGLGLILDAGDPSVNSWISGERRTINDGRWHHVIAEVDRGRDLTAVYIDGKRETDDRTGLPAGASLSNTADLLVGKGRGPAPGGKPFAGEIEFLRIARGTLADARTTIDELYAWQFQTGPFLRDFTGRAIADGKRDAGALEAAPSSAAAAPQ
jgi:hypothetical protein